MPDVLNIKVDDDDGDKIRLEKSSEKNQEEKSSETAKATIQKGAE